MSETANRLTRASEPAESHPAQSESKSDTACDSLLGTVKSTFDPFKQTFSSDGSVVHHVSEAVNSLASLQSMPSQLLNTGIAQIPLLDKMPGMPAATIGVPHLGTPHAHSHPPSNGFPLPSVGATIGSGCLSVLIGGIPAARVLDIGIAPTCGGLTPYFDIQTGSSNTFIGGMRAARMGVDITRHCNPMGHVGKSGGEAASAAEKSEEVASEAAQVTGRAKLLGRAGKAWRAGNAALGPASGVATAADDVSQGEIAAAAMMAAQTAADLAFMMLSNLMGKDPGIEPSMGTLLVGDPSVLIGGFPMPDSQMMWHGAKHGIGKKVRPKLPKWAQKLACEMFGEPVSAVTGEVENDFTDYETDDVVPFRWGRHYSSGWHDRDGVMGYGFRHTWQHELQLLRTRAVYIDPRGTEYTFPRLEDGTYGGSCQGYVLGQQNSLQFIVHHGVEGDAEFERDERSNSIARCVSHMRNGIRSRLHWHPNDRIGKITQFDRSGQIRRLIALRYDQFGRIVEVVLTNVDGRDAPISRYEYDLKGCLIGHRNALDALSACKYDVQRRMVQLANANDYSFFYRYDSEGRCVESRGQDGLWHIQLQYYPGRTIVTEADSGKWTVLYNEARTITRVVDPFGDAAEYVLGADGRIESEIDSSARIIRWLYDGSGRNTGRMDRWGNLWPIKDVTPILPDRPLHTVPGAPMDLLWGEIDLPGAVSEILLPPQIETVAATVFGHVVTTTAGPVEKRDAAGRIVERTGKDGHTELFHRDAVGNVIAWRDGDGHDYSYEIASWNIPVAETDPLGNVTRHRYTSKEQIEAIVDPNGNESLYAYDHKGRITSVVRHGVVRETYTYDAANLLTEKRDGTGNLLIRYEAGNNGLYRRRILASGETHTYDYDTRGNTIRASTETDDVTLTYDLTNRRTSDKRSGLGVEHAFSGEHLTRTTYFGRFTVRYETVSPSEVRIHTPEGHCHRLQWSADKKVLLEAANGTTILSGFDGAKRCIGQIVWIRQREEQARCVRYKYSATGELRRVISDIGDTKEYQYDAAHRLIGEYHNDWPVRKYEYDRGGNLLSTPAVPWMRYCEGNRLASSSVGTFRYSRRNHLTEFTSISGIRTTYKYNSKDLLTKVSWSDRSEEWTASYDGLCRRIRQEYDGKKTNYYWDGDRLAAELGINGSLRLYIYPNESSLVPFLFIDYPSADAPPDEGLAYLVCSNQVGLPQWIEDCSGSVAWVAADIDPYGKVQVAEGNSVDYNLRFPGHYFDAVTGLHYNRFRSYCPEFGRYLQSDPIGQSGGINLYAYPTNPVVVVDVLGLKESCGTHDSIPDPEAETPKTKPPVDLERGLQALRDRLKRKINKEIRTAGVGVSDVPGFEAISDVPGLQRWVFEVWSPRVRRALGMTTTPGPIHSPYSHPFKEHAEEEFGNQFIAALKEVGYTEDKNGIFHDPIGTARLLMNASPVGCCSICLLDLRSSGKNVGVVKQLSQKVPNVKFIFETDGHPGKTITVLGGKILS
ncbi:RHS repeat-associated core domain-containing protein [Burkholderia sp. DN3021]|uniref:RHS repeat-associated core domain-containing protein n=1 Tax=Burkholderia sp. DN3021 TaxID=3410137 RepID=UPI003C79F073